MRVLVTGATGFVGQHLVPVLEALGHTLTIAVRNPASDRARKFANGPPTRRLVGVGAIDGNTDWTAALAEVGCVVHLAARAHVLGEGADDDEAFFETNVRGTDRIVAQSIDAGIEHFVLMSSVGAVTTASDSLVTLKTPCRPDTAYGRSKLDAERVLLERAESARIDWTILRPTLVYGPGNPGNMARLVAYVKRGLPLPIGNVRNRRSFTSVQNLIDVVGVVVGHPNARNACFFVSDGEDLSTPELIARIARAGGMRPRLFPLPNAVRRALGRLADGLSNALSRPLPFGTAALHRLESSLFVDIRDLEAAVGWTPSHSVDDGLRQMLEGL